MFGFIITVCSLIAEYRVLHQLAFSDYNKYAIIYVYILIIHTLHTDNYLSSYCRISTPFYLCYIKYV